MTRYVNTGAAAWWSRRRGSNPKALARRLSVQYRALKKELGKERASSVAVEVQPYDGINQHVHRMADALSPVKEHLVGAFVHGSVGSYEEVSYSDFDGLVILSDSTVMQEDRLREVAGKLRRAQSIMIDYDPLQHHGWFVMTELDLAHYCEAYFPLILFEHAKAVDESAPLRLECIPRDSRRECIAFFRQLSASLAVQSAAGVRPDTMYELKSFLSRLMLLPAAYLQARDGVGVWKRDSFELARHAFHSTSWHCIDQATLIRSQWPVVRYPTWLWRNGGWSHVSKRVRKFASGRIRDPLKGFLREDVFRSVEQLVGEMHERIGTE